MNLRRAQRPEAGMTRLEVGVVMVIILVLLAFLLPELSASRRKASRISCNNYLKQVGLASRIWEGDHGDRYPMAVSVTNGGSMEMVQTGNVVQTFMVMSNELSTPYILYCPADTCRRRPAMFNGLTNLNISYFVNVEATNDLNPQMVLSGDCNFETNGVAVGSGLQRFGTNDPVEWSASRHGSHSANIAMADGSVQSATIEKGHCVNLQLTGFPTNSFAVP